MTEESDKKNAPVDYEALRKRLGEEMLRQRLLTQANHWADTVFQGESIFRLERYLPMDKLIRWILKLSGTYWWGHRNFLDLQVNENLVVIDNLPSALVGLRVLHLSDLHLDLSPDLTPKIIENLARLQYDIAVITGDFRNSSTGNHADALDETRKVIEALRPPIIGILGNHDFIEMVPGLEEMGIQLLLNETAILHHNGTQILIAGIDDPHFYKTENFEALKQEKDAYGLKLLLSHSPETYSRANSYGFDMLLCGHTHGGQICLPNGKAILKIGNCPDDMLNGAWEFNTLKGYTSRGTGSCGVPVRFFCPPEIVIHELRKSAPTTATGDESLQGSR